MVWHRVNESGRMDRIDLGIPDMKKRRIMGRAVEDTWAVELGGGIRGFILDVRGEHSQDA